MLVSFLFFFFVKQKTAYEVRISDWSSDVCSSDLAASSCSRYFSIVFCTSRLCGWVAPGGRRNCTIAPPWSSVGRKLVGRRKNISASKIGRASWRERVRQYESMSVVPVLYKKQNRKYR